MADYIDPKIEAMCDATRRTIIERLARGALSVGEIASAFPISRPAVSQHLRILKEAGLVADRPDGNRRLYQLNRAEFASLRDYFAGFLQAPPGSDADGAASPEEDRSWRAW